MVIDNLEFVQGKEFTITELMLLYENSEFNLTLKGFSNKYEVLIHCFNTSHLNIQNLSAPMQICGFEIICNKSKGWERTSNYTIHDFEENRIEFLCENIEIIVLNS